MLRCVEPANVADGDGYVVVADSSESVLFPHVDSCLAIAFMLADNRIVGGHVGMQWGGSDDIKPADNSLRIVDEMLTCVGRSKISYVVFLGDPNWKNGVMREMWSEMDSVTRYNMRPVLGEILARIQQLPGTQRPANVLTLLKGEIDGGVDVCVTRHPGLNVTVSRFKVPCRRLYARALISIMGNEEDSVNN